MRPFPGGLVASLLYFHKIFVVLPTPKHHYLNKVVGQHYWSAKDENIW
jgi:hypothetical protein